MLFTPAVAAYLNEHFVPAVTDPDWLEGKRRNPELWDRSETWKTSPGNAQILWAVSADTALRSGVFYQTYPTPEALLRWLENLRILDGAIEDPEPRAVHGAVIQHFYERAQDLYRWRGEGRPDAAFHGGAQTYGQFVAAMPAASWSTADQVEARLRTLRLDPPRERAALRARIAAWFESWDGLEAGDRPEAPWLAAVRRTFDATGLLRADELTAMLAVLEHLRPPD